MSIKNANFLFRNGDFLGALEQYKALRKSMPSLAYMLDASIVRCTRALEKSTPANELLAASADSITRVRFFPDYTASNPYQRLLYSDQSTNVQVMSGTIADADEDLRTAAVDVSIFHLHWISHVLANSSDEVDASTRVEAFLHQLNSYTAAGGRVVWTIHNSLEHDCKFISEEIRLRQGICDAAWRVHIHSKSALLDIEQYYRVPLHKLVVVPHGNYSGYYPDFVSREDARAALGIAADEVVFLSLGMIRPYKGLETLLSAFAELRKTSPRARLVIAGKVVHPYHPDHIEAIVGASPGVTLCPREIPDVELQYFFRAADTCVLTYNKILTSGSLYLALTFGQSVIGPNVPAISELVSKNLGLLYDQDDSVASLVHALKAFVKLSPAARAQLRANASHEILSHNWRGAVQRLFSHQCDYESSRRITEQLFEIELRSVRCEMYTPDTVISDIDVAVLILNYNSSEDVRELLVSLKKISGFRIATIIIDNCSPSETMRGLIAEFSDCYIIRTPENIGYAAGNNVGIRFAQTLGAKYTWILNPDTVVKDDTLAELIRGEVADASTDIWGSLITYYDRPNTLWFGGGFVNMDIRCAIGHMYHDKPLSSAPTMPYEVDYVTGASIFCRTSIFGKAGLIPEHYFLYFEETDWCTRARAAGLTIKVNPASVLYHKKRSQNGALPTKYYFYYFVRGAMLFRLRYAKTDAHRAKNEILESFVLPWLKRIKAISASEYEFFLELSNKALYDGASGRSGRQDLLRLLGDASWADVATNELIVGECHVGPSNILVGSVVNRAQPHERLAVTVAVDGKEVGKAAVSQKTYDKISGGGGCDFHFLLPESVVDGATHLIELTAEGEVFCQLTEVIAVGKEQLTGRIDGLQDRFLRGWCIDEGNPQRTLVVKIFSGDRLIAQGLNNVARPDVLRAGFKNHLVGFSMPLPLEFCDGTEHELRLQVENVLVRSRKIRMDLERFPSAPVGADFDQLQGWLYAYRELSFTRVENRSLPALVKMDDLRAVSVLGAENAAQKARVSIVMPLYNREAIVRQAIMSVIHQRYQNWELLICDDGSTDRSVEVVLTIVAEYGIAEKVQIISDGLNRGVSAARNKCLEVATGDLISYLDSDNTWDPDYLLVMVNALAGAGAMASAYCGDRIVQHYGEVHSPEIVGIRFGPLNRTLLTHKNYIDLNVFVHTRQIYETLGGFREDMRRLVDWELILRYLNVGTVRSVPLILATYNLDACGNQITRTADYNLNADLLKATVEELWESKPEPSRKDEKRGVHIFLMDAPVHESYSKLILQAWKNSAERSTVNVSEIGCGGNGVLDDANMETLRQLLMMCSEAGHDVVLAAKNSIPRHGWLNNCRSICETSPDIGAVISTQFVIGNAIDSHPKAVYRNSRRDFRYDIAPLYFIPAVQDYSTDYVRVERLESGNIFVPNDEIPLLLEMLEQESGSAKSAIESYTVNLNQRGRNAVYSPRFEVIVS